MHPRIHVSISYSFKKKIITWHASSHHVIHHTPQNHWKLFPKKQIKKFEKKSAMTFFVSLTNVRHSCGVCSYFKSKIQVLFYTSGPSTRQWSLTPLWPSTRRWSSISLHQDPLRGNDYWFSFIHQDPLRGNGHWFICHIEALCEAMVIDSFTLRPSARQW